MDAALRTASGHVCSDQPFGPHFILRSDNASPQASNLVPSFHVRHSGTCSTAQVRVEMEARAATCDTLARNMEAAHLETEQLLAQQAPLLTAHAKVFPILIYMLAIQSAACRRTIGDRQSRERETAVLCYMLHRRRQPEARCPQVCGLYRMRSSLSAQARELNRAAPQVDIDLDLQRLESQRRAAERDSMAACRERDTMLHTLKGALAAVTAAQVCRRAPCDGRIPSDGFVLASVWAI